MFFIIKDLCLGPELECIFPKKIPNEDFFRFLKSEKVITDFKIEIRFVNIKKHLFKKIVVKKKF